MPLRQDPSLWWNLPGIVAAYQPVCAPDSLLARYNMRQGGTSAFRAEPGVLPPWSGVSGWSFNNQGYLVTGILPVRNGSYILKFTNASSPSGVRLALVSAEGANSVSIRPVPGVGVNRVDLANGGGTAFINTPAMTSGILALSGNLAYRDGMILGNMPSWAMSNPSALTIGGTINGSSLFLGKIQCLSVYSRILSGTEIWHASRQMAYCDVNPEWSVWSPRRKWFPYVLAGTAAGRVGIYGARPTVALPGGVRIVPQDEGGVNG